MTQRLIRIGLLITSLFCYLEWGGGNSSFLFQAEYSLFTGFTGTSSFMHPLILLPLAGQVLLIITLLQAKPSRRLTVIGILCINALVLFIFLVGILSINIKILGSTLPFILLSVYYIFFYKKDRRQAVIPEAR